MQTQSSADRITTSLSLVHQRKTNKDSEQTSPYRKLTHTTGPTLGGQKPKGRKKFSLEAWEKEASNTVSLKKKNSEKAENTTQMKEQSRNTEGTFFNIVKAIYDKPTRNITQ